MSEEDVTKVDELRDLVAQSISREEWLHYLDEFEQAVRDEEFDLHSCAVCSYQFTKNTGPKWGRCEGCPADGTRYCP